MIVVIGAGVVGASIAYRMAERGADVTLVDAGKPGEGTTSRSFAWLNGNNKHPDHYQRLNAEGVAAHRRLANSLGHDRWLHLTGSLHFEIDPVGELETRVERLRRLDYPAELISSDRARELEPAVRFERATSVAWFSGEGWAHGPTLAGKLVEAARERGARVLTDAAVRAIEPLAVLVPGARIEAERIVVATGRHSDAVGRLAGIDVPLAPTSGLLPVTGPVSPSPRMVVYAPDVQFRPEPGGRLVLQADDTDARTTDETPPDAESPDARELLRRALHHVPALAGADLEEVRVGTRALPADGHPLVGEADASGRLYLAVTHSGMTLGPLLGELVAEELTTGRRSEWLTHYRPERLVRPSR